MKKRLACVLVLVGTIFSHGAVGLLDKDLSISLETKQVENLSLTALNYVFYINIMNKSSDAYFLTRYRYRFVVEEKEYLQMHIAPSEGLEVNASGKTMIAIPVKITYEHLFQENENVRNLDSVSCYLMGELFFSDGRKERGSLPIAFSGGFPIFRTPEVELAALIANTISIGGADLDFQVKIINPNGFDLRVDDIRCILKLGGHPIYEGRFEGDKNIVKKGERIFTLHLLLNFFDVGKDVYSLLLQKHVEVSFSGEIEFRTDWGRMIIPLVGNKNLEISRSD